MNFLGISAFYHDSAACLVRNGKIIAVAQEERFSRIKHNSKFSRYDSKSSIIKEFWYFLRVRKKWWLTPIVVMLLLLGALIILTEGSAIAPFIYTLF